MYCSGAGCTAFGTPVINLANDTNWTVLMRFRIDPTITAGNHDLFSQSTLVGGAFTCAGIYFRVAKSGANFPLNINLTTLGGISSFTLFGSTTNVVPGSWYAMALTHDSSHNWKLYLNSTAPDATFSGSETIGTGCDTFFATVSGATDCGGSEVGCWLTDPAFYSSVLPTGDIKAFMSGTRPNILSVYPVAWYAMEGSNPAPCTYPGGLADPDSSGNLHPLKLGNDPAPDYCSGISATDGPVMQASGEATH